jgi:hypothetical protein
MERGYVIDRGYGTITVSEWVAGIPEVGRWTRSLKLRKRSTLPTTTYRCPRCGYLESYAFTG